jgi:type IV secretory pathway VirB6-like protein
MKLRISFSELQTKFLAQCYSIHVKCALLLICLLGLSSCDASILGSFLNWCKVENRDVVICYANSSDESCGVTSDLTTVATVNASGYYGASADVPIGSNAGSDSACGNKLIGCQSQASIDAYKDITFSAENNIYNYSTSNAYTPLDCNSGINPFLQNKDNSPGSCNMPNADGSSPVNPPVCNNDDADLYTHYCDIISVDFINCEYAYQKCISASGAKTPSQNTAYGQWIASDLQIDSTQTVTLDPSATSGSITLTQPLGLRQVGNKNSFATALQNYQAKLQQCLDAQSSNSPLPECQCASGGATPAKDASDFCLFQYCADYNQELKATDSGYIAACDCRSSSQTSALSDFCKYGIALKNDDTSTRLNDFANGGKGILIPFYFDNTIYNNNYPLADPSVEQVGTIDNTPVSQGFGSTKVLLDSSGQVLKLMPNQVLTFTVDTCENGMLTDPYTSPPPFPYGNLSGWNLSSNQLQKLDETFQIPNYNSVPPFSYQYRGPPVSGSQCSSACGASSGSNSAPTSLSSAGNTYTKTRSFLDDSQGCWHTAADNINIKIGDGTAVALSNIINNGGTYLNAQSQAANQNSLYLSFAPPQVPSVNQDIASLQDSMNQNLCQILANTEPGVMQKPDLNLGSCKGDGNRYGLGGSSGNSNRCYLVIEGVNDRVTSIDAWGKPYNYQTGNLWASYNVYNTGDTKTLPYKLYCAKQIQPVDADNCIDGANLTNQNIDAINNACTNNNGSLVLRGYLGYSCCYKYGSDPNVDLESTIRSALANVPDGLGPSNSAGLRRIMDIAGMVALSPSGGSSDNYYAVNTTLFNPFESNGSAVITGGGVTQGLDNCNPFMWHSGGRWTEYVDKKTIPNLDKYVYNARQAGDVIYLDKTNYQYVGRAPVIYFDTKNPYSQSTYPAYVYYYDTTNNRASLENRRSCFPYLGAQLDGNNTPLNGSDGPYSCPSVLGNTFRSSPIVQPYDTKTIYASSMIQQSCMGTEQSCPVTQSCDFGSHNTEGTDNHTGFRTVCCYQDNMSLTGDATPNLGKLLYMRRNYVSALNNAASADTQNNQNTTRAALASDIVGGVNVYVKSVPALYSHGRFLQMIISEDDPNKLTKLPNAATFVDANDKTLPCTASSASCVPQVCVKSIRGGNCQGTEPSGSGRVWLRILDDPNQGGDGVYSNNTGSYNVKLQAEQKMLNPTNNNKSGGLFGSLLSVVQTTLSKTLKSIYNTFTRSGDFLTYISFMCQVYIIITAFYYILGITKYNHLEFVIKIIKLCVVAAVTKPEFSEFMINDLPKAVFGGQGYLIASATGRAAGTGANFDPFYMFNQVFEFFFVDTGNAYRFIAIFSMGGGGLILALLILVCCFFYLFALIDALKAYFIAIMSLAIMFAMAPLMISFVLFSKTREIFDNWVRHILQYMLEPVLLFTGLSILSVLILSQLYVIFSDGVCLKCVVNFIVGFSSVSPFSNLMNLCIPGLLPYGFDNEGRGLIDMYFTYFGESAVLLILALILKNYNHFIQSISLQIVMAGGRSITGMTSYNNLIDGGNSSGGSLAAMQKFTGLSKDMMAARKQGTMQQALASFQGRDDASQQTGSSGKQSLSSRSGSGSGSATSTDGSAGSGAGSGSGSGSATDGSAGSGSGSGAGSGSGGGSSTDGSAGSGAGSGSGGGSATDGSAGSGAGSGSGSGRGRSDSR